MLSPDGLYTHCYVYIQLYIYTNKVNCTYIYTDKFLYFIYRNLYMYIYICNFSLIRRKY